MNAADSETVARVLFVGVFPCGLSYADRTREESGDYARLAFLSYRTLRLETYPAFRTAPKCVRDAITASARDMESRRGQHYEVSAAGQTVLLGYEPTEADRERDDRHRQLVEIASLGGYSDPYGDDNR